MLVIERNFSNSGQCYGGRYALINTDFLLEERDFSSLSLKDKMRLGLAGLVTMSTIGLETADEIALTRSALSAKKKAEMEEVARSAATDAVKKYVDFKGNEVVKPQRTMSNDFSAGTAVNDLKGLSDGERAAMNKARTVMAKTYKRELRKMDRKQNMEARHNQNIAERLAKKQERQAVRQERLVARQEKASQRVAERLAKKVPSRVNKVPRAVDRY